MVPKGWSRSTLGEVATFKNGLNFNKADSGESIKIVGVGDFKNLSELRNTESLEFIQVEKRVSDEELLKSGDLLFVRSNGNKELIGRCLFFPNVSERLSYSGFTIRGRVNTQKILPEYASNLVREKHITQQIFQYGGGTNISNLSQQILSDLIFALPPLNEQEKITKILSVWEKSITTTEQLLANSQQQKKALMQKLLTGKVRLLDEDGVRFEGDWEHGRLGDLCTFKGGSAFKEEYQGNTEGDFPFIKVSDMNLCGNEKYIVHSNNWVTKENTSLMKVKPFPADAVVFAKVGAALLLNRRRILSRPTIIDNNMMAAIPTKSGNTMFIYQLMLAIDFAKFVQDGAVPSVNQGDLAAFKISYPVIEEQRKIAEVLSAAEREIALFQEKIDTLKVEKKALMQQLLTGKRRVSIN